MGGRAATAAVLSQKRNRADERGKERAEEARSNPDREVGDANKVIAEGRPFTDSQTGLDVFVKGDRVVITKPDGSIHTQFKNTRKNTQRRIRNGKWVPK